MQHTSGDMAEIEPSAPTSAASGAASHVVPFGFNDAGVQTEGHI